MWNTYLLEKAFFSPIVRHYSRTVGVIFVIILSQSVGDIGVQMEVERLLVKQFAVEQQESARNVSFVHTSGSHRTATKKQRPKYVLS